jgi:hypothetical protein
VFEVIPICKSVAETRGGVVTNWLGCEGYQDCTTAKLGGMPFVTQNPTRLEILCASHGQYVGWPVESLNRLLLSSVLGTSRPQGVMRMDSQSVCLAL